MENPEKRMLRIKKLLHELPDLNFDTFRFLAQHLSRVAGMGHVNKVILYHGYENVEFARAPQFS